MGDGISKALRERVAAAARLYAPAACTCYDGPLRDLIRDLFQSGEGIVAICSLGAVVRLIAPHLRDKYRDPAVVVLDEAGRQWPDWSPAGQSALFR
jgi:cobalt-precorrin 5A hydrolase